MSTIDMNGIQTSVGVGTAQQTMQHMLTATINILGPVVSDLPA